MVRHKNLISVDIHVIHAFTFADAAARTGATGLVAADIGKVAKQTDDNSYYVLTAITPTWDAITASGTTGEYSDGGDTKGKDRILGSNDNFDQSFETNNIIRMHIQKDGKIGIGPGFTAPLNDWHVRNDQDADTQLLIENQDTGVSARSIVTVGEDLSSTNFGSFQYSNSGVSDAVWTRIKNSVVVFGANNATGGLILGSLGGPIRFFPNSSAAAFADEELQLTTNLAKVFNELEIDGDLNHDGTKIGFFGTAPAVQAAAYTRNAAIVEDRTLLASASATTINNNNVLAALIADLQSYGLIQ